MKVIGIVGGLSAESAAQYYLTITRTHQARTGNSFYPEIRIHSVNFGLWTSWAMAGRWDTIGGSLVAAAHSLAAAGADLGVIASNTMHRAFDRLRSDSPIPFLSLVDVVAAQLVRQGVTNAALTGTEFTMSSSLYPDGLRGHGIEVTVPEAADRAEIHRAIYDELVHGTLRAETRDAMLAAFGRLAERGAQAVIMGCTEIPLLLAGHEARSPLALVDTATLHAVAAYEAALE
jgi:aspartate racemase